MKILVIFLSVIISSPVFAQGKDPWQEFLEQSRQRTHEEDTQRRWLEDAEKNRQQSERNRQSVEDMERNRAWGNASRQPAQQLAPDQTRPKNCMLVANIVHCY